MPHRARIAQLIDALQLEGGIAGVDRLSERTGRSPRAIRDLARAARLWEPFASVFGLPRPRPSSRDLALAATIRYAGRTGEPARDLVAVTRLSALALLGVQATAPTRVDLVVPATRCPRVDPRCTILRSQHLAAPEVRRLDRVPVVTGPALARDLAGVRTIERLRADVIELCRIGDADLPEIQAMVDTCDRFTGRGRLRRVITELATVGRVDSPLELEARKRFRSAGITLDPGQVCVPRPTGFLGRWRMHLDLGISALRFGIEVDSFRYHASPAALRRDAQRANRLAALPEDWRVIHLTWADLDAGWTDFVALTKRVIAAQAARHGFRDGEGVLPGGPGITGQHGRCGC